MTKEELEKATGQELIDERNYCGVDGYYGDYLDNVNAEMLKRFNRLAELEAQIEKMKCCANCKHSRTEYEHCRTDKHEKWEIKEKCQISFMRFASLLFVYAEQF